MTPELVNNWHATLMDDEEWEWWTEVRGVDEGILKERKIGVQGNRCDAPKGFRYTIPVWDADKLLVDVKKYAPGSRDRKNIHTRGYGRPCRFYGVDWLAELDSMTDEAWVFGGEPDALRGMSAGLLAVSGTSGEGAVPRAGTWSTCAGSPSTCASTWTMRAGAEPISGSLRCPRSPPRSRTSCGRRIRARTSPTGSTTATPSRSAQARRGRCRSPSQRPLAELLDWALNRKLPAVAPRNETGSTLPVSYATRSTAGGSRNDSWSRPTCLLSLTRRTTRTQPTPRALRWSRRTPAAT